MNSQGMEYLNTRLMFGMKPGLKTTYDLCDYLGNPEKSFKAIHVVGTNGKGSTTYYLSGMLTAHGYRTGFYSSPHLVSLRERIRVDDEPISDEDLDRLILQVKAAAEALSIEPTFFEVLTLVAFLYYKQKNVDVAVLEAGMGGRLDSTAVARGNIAVVTSIGLEHTEVLGDSEKKILREKMAVLSSKNQGNGKQTYIVGGLSAELLDEARFYAESRGVPCRVPAARDDIRLPNLGRHYIENARLALLAVEVFMAKEGMLGASKSFDEGLALKTLEGRSWAGRMQILTDETGRPRIILDGAHNSHAVRRLSETLSEYYPGQKFPCVFGALKDKDVSEMLQMMAPHISAWHLTKTPYPRFRELEDLLGLMNSLQLPVATSAELSKEYLDQVLSQAGDTPVLITGSLYMIGAVIELLRNDFQGLEFFRNMIPSTNEHR